MKCEICKKKFRDGELVVPLMKYTLNSKIDSATPFAQEHIHLSHLKNKE